MQDAKRLRAFADLREMRNESWVPIFADPQIHIMRRVHPVVVNAESEHAAVDASHNAAVAQRIT